MSTPPEHADAAAAAQAAAASRSGLWSRFARRHLHDYNATATARWLTLAAAGALAAAWALLQLAALPVADLWRVALGVGFPTLTGADASRTTRRCNGNDERNVDWFATGVAPRSGASNTAA